ncbi:hypothetical protein SMD44_08841 [Streptomyces alboflavus]|uniref:Uncharacterized protein n=1 Tax=Streptomyces alboflavus TaxID=67267 RepID=A0A1Z1WSI9_9ACTN|nr:hypothetical protein SMD44_08841 [Streptomyces alboflavus]
MDDRLAQPVDRVGPVAEHPLETATEQRRDSTAHLPGRSPLARPSRRPRAVLHAPRTGSSTRARASVVRQISVKAQTAAAHSRSQGLPAGLAAVVSARVTASSVRREGECHGQGEAA